MPNAGFINYQKTTAKEDNALTALRADDVAAAIARGETPDTNEAYTVRILTGVFADWMAQALALAATKGDSKAIIDALRAGTPTPAQIAAAKTALGL